MKGSIRNCCSYEDIGYQNAWAKRWSCTKVSVGSAALLAFVAGGRQEASGGCRDRAVAHERNRLLQVGVEVPVILKMRHLPTQDCAHSFERWARCQRGMKIASLGCR